MGKIDVASYIAARMAGADEMQLQKLLYFTHGWTLAWRGRPMFEGEFEAWIGGPVDDEIWRVRRENRLPAAPVLDESDRAIIDAVVDYYAHLTGKQMSDLTHAPGTPWSNTRGELPANHGSKRHIPDREIRDHFLEIALKSDSRPGRPREAADADTVEVAGVASGQSDRWRKALDELATR